MKVTITIDLPDDLGVNDNDLRELQSAVDTFIEDALGHETIDGDITIQTEVTE
jgi:hypothetical protein